MGDPPSQNSYDRSESDSLWKISPERPDFQSIEPNAILCVAPREFIIWFSHRLQKKLKSTDDFQSEKFRLNKICCLCVGFTSCFGEGVTFLNWIFSMRRVEGADVDASKYFWRRFCVKKTSRQIQFPSHQTFKFRFFYCHMEVLPSFYQLECLVEIYYRFFFNYLSNCELFYNQNFRKIV